MFLPGSTIETIIRADIDALGGLLMSTRDTIAATEDLHLYRDVFTEDVFLSTAANNFKVSAILGPEETRALLREFAVEVIMHYEFLMDYPGRKRFSWREYTETGFADNYKDPWRDDSLWQ